MTPWGIRHGLNWIKNHYNNVPVYVTENGVSDNNGTIYDQHRIDYLKAYINEVLKGKYLHFGRFHAARHFSMLIPLLL